MKNDHLTARQEAIIFLVFMGVVLTVTTWSFAKAEQSWLPALIIPLAFAVIFFPALLFIRKRKTRLYEGMQDLAVALRTRVTYRRLPLP